MCKKGESFFIGADPIVGFAPFFLTERRIQMRFGWRFCFTAVIFYKKLSFYFDHISTEHF